MNIITNLGNWFGGQIPGATESGAPTLVGLNAGYGDRSSSNHEPASLIRCKPTKVGAPGRIVAAAWLAMGVLGLSIGFAQQPDANNGVDNSSASATNTVSAQAETPDTGSAAKPGGNADDAEPSRGMHHEVLFKMGHDAELKAGDTADEVVVIFGSAKVDGKVRGSVVTVFGNLDISGEAQDAVTVMGNLTAGPNTLIHDSVVTVGGHQDAPKTAKLGSNPVELDFPEWIKGWIGHCLLLARPLAPQVGFVWLIALVFILLYAFIAVLLPRPVQACVNELTTRPATTCLIGLLSLVLVPLVLGILIATGLGIIVVPFLIAALFFAGLLGRVALFEWIGFSLVGHLAENVIIKPLLALLVGAVVIAILYIIPLVGLFTFAIISVWGLGAVTLAAFGGLRRELPEKPAAPMPPPASPAVPPISPVDPSNPAGAPAFTPPPFGSGVAAATAAVAPPPVLPDVLSYPRAGFWERMGAAFLDLILIGVATPFGFHFIGPFAFLVAVAYFAGLWSWRGTSIGGIVLGLKVVRLDGQPVSFAVALVRALAAAFSVVVLFLGFLWIAWDVDKQGWHDKIAGTVVLKLPRGTPLVCL